MGCFSCCGCCKGKCCGCDHLENVSGNEPIFRRSGKRPCCTDFLCLILFLAAWGVLIWVLQMVYAKGANPYYTIRAVDYRGRICGMDADVTDRPYGAWPNPLDYTFKVCVASCNATSGGDTSVQAFFPAQYTSQALLFYCLPKFNGTISISLGGDFASYGEQASRAIGDLFTVWPMILASAFVALVFSYMYSVLQRCFAGCFVWTGLFLVAAGGAMGSFVLLWRAKLAKDQGDVDNRSLAMEVVGWILAGFTVIFLLVICALYDRIKIAIELVKAGGRAIIDMPCIILFPINAFIFMVLYASFWVFGAALIFGVKERDSEPVPDFLDAAVAADMGPAYYGNYTVLNWNEDLKKTFALHVFHGLWNVQFIVYFTYLVVAGAAAQWYFSEWDANGSYKQRSISCCASEDYRLDRFPVFKSCVRATCKNVGSVAFGALIIAVIKFLRLLLAYLEKTTQSEKPNKLQRILFAVISCCLACLQCCLDKISKNAYIWMAIWGSHFLASSITSFSLVWNNLGRALAVSVVGTYLMGLGKLLVGLVSAGATGLVIMKVYDKELNSIVMPLLVMFVLSYMVAAVFMVVYETIIDALFICFLVDEQKNRTPDNAAIRNYAPKELSERIHKEAADAEIVSQTQYTKEVVARREVRLHGGQVTRTCPQCHRLTGDQLVVFCGSCGTRLPQVVPEKAGGCC